MPARQGKRLDENLHLRILEFLELSCYSFSGPTEFYSLAVNIESALHGLPMVGIIKFGEAKNPRVPRVHLEAGLVKSLSRLVDLGVYYDEWTALRQAAYNVLEKCLAAPTLEAPCIARWRPGQSAASFEKHLRDNPGASWNRFLLPVHDTGGPICCPANRIHAIPDTRFRTWKDFGIIEPRGTQITQGAWVHMRWLDTMPRAQQKRAEPAPADRPTLEEQQEQETMFAEGLARLQAFVASPEGQAAERRVRAWIQECEARERRNAKDFRHSEIREKLRSGSFLSYPELSWPTKVWLVKQWQSSPTPHVEATWESAWRTVQGTILARATPKEPSPTT